LEKEFILGQTDKNMMDIGRMEKNMDKVSCIIQMEEFMMEIGLMINGMVMKP
jgi:hypothetical protein